MPLVVGKSSVRGGRAYKLEGIAWLCVRKTDSGQAAWAQVLDELPAGCVEFGIWLMVVQTCALSYIGPLKQAPDSA